MLSKFKNLYKKFKQWNNERIIEKIECKHNLKKWKKIICIDNQFDFIYILIILRHKLLLMFEVWGLETDHEGDFEEKDKIMELIQMLDKTIEIASENNNVEHHEEYQRIAKSFFGKLYRLHDKLYD